MPMLSGELRPGRSPISTTTILAPSTSPTSSPTATRASLTMTSGAIRQSVRSAPAASTSRNASGILLDGERRQPVADDEDHIVGIGRREARLQARRAIAASRRRPLSGRLQITGGSRRRYAAHDARARVTQGLPASRQCSAHDARRCGRGHAQAGIRDAAWSAGSSRSGPSAMRAGVYWRSLLQGLVTTMSVVVVRHGDGLNADAQARAGTA